MVIYIQGRCEERVDLRVTFRQVSAEVEAMNAARRDFACIRSVIFCASRCSATVARAAAEAALSASLLARSASR